MTASPRPSVVFLGAHPDDVVMAAGTLLLLSKTHQIHDFCLTRGARGYHIDNETPATKLKPPRDDVAERRSREEAAVCALLGAELLFFDQEDGELFAGRELCERVAAELARIKPVALITLWPLQKPDHAAAAHVARHALYLSDLIWTTELYMAGMYGEDHGLCVPEIYVNITSVMDRKIELLRCYESQWSARALAWITEQSKVYGRQAWCEYAEPFVSGMPLMATRWERPAGSLLLQLAAVS